MVGFPQPVSSDFNPCTFLNESQVLPAPFPGETYGDLERYEQATSDVLSDDLDMWTLGDTGYGWSVPVDLGFTMSDLEANKAVPADSVLPVLKDLPSVCAEDFSWG